MTCVRGVNARKVGNKKGSDGPPYGVPIKASTNIILEIVPLVNTLASTGFELGQDDFSRSLVRILDIGGLIWESDERFETVDQALAAAERALAQWIEENLFHYGADVR